jgi:hypothetical protein
MRMCLAMLLTSGLAALAPVDGTAQNADAMLPLRVGAASIDITPTQLPRNYLGVLDRLHARAIVLNDGATTAALITVDAGAVGEATWQAVTTQLETEFGIPPANVLLAATHTHSAGGAQGADYVSRIVDAVRQARQALQPARAGYGTGVSYINVNRQSVDPSTGRWREGANREGPSDKTVAVLAFERPDGKPIAVYFNYAVHGVIAGQLDQISGDIPGAASRYVEEALAGEVVALFSPGAAGDQNPIYYQQTYDLRDIRTKEYANRGVDISNAMPPGGQGLNRDDPAVARLMNQQRRMVVSMGQFLGEEVLYVLRNTTRTVSALRLRGSQRTIQCPGRERTNQGRAGVEGTYKEAGPVDIRLGMLRVGEVMIGAVNAEVFNPIAQRLKRESPYKATVLSTLTNGSARSGYVPDDASYGKHTFEVLSSRVQPGCAENAIVNALLDLMEDSR